MSTADTPPRLLRKIRRVSPLQFGKVSALCYFIVSLIFVLIFIPFYHFVSLHSPAGRPAPTRFTPAFFLILPILYGIAGFVFGVIGAAVYNLIAGWVGGIEVQVE